MVMHATEASRLSQQQRKRTMKAHNLEKYEKMVLELLGKKLRRVLPKVRIDYLIKLVTTFLNSIEMVLIATQFILVRA